MWQEIDPGWGLLLVGLVGWVWGSFLDQLISRTPRADSVAADGRPMGLFHPWRSVCLSCGSVIPWYNNLPVISFVVQGGRCRRCHAAIGWRTLIVEVLTPAGFLLLFPAVAERAPAGFVAAYLGLSWVLLAGCVLWEGRRVGWWFWVVGVGLLAAAARMA